MKTSYKIALIVTAVLIIAGVLFALHMYNLQHKDLKKVKPDFILSATDLQKEFENNETAATTKYVNKVLEVSGIIQSVKPGENYALSIALKTGSDLSSVICTLAGNPPPSSFNIGDQVTLRGECSGFLMDVLLNNCAVAPPGK